MDLKLALQLNAVFSLATGLVLAIAPATVGGWLDVSIDQWLRLLGVSLVAHGGFLLWATAQDAVATWAKLNVAAIGPYPLIVVIIVATGLVDRGLGQGLVLADGVVVGLLAMAQWSGLRAHQAPARTVPA